MAAQVARLGVTQLPSIIKKEERDILMSDISPQDQSHNPRGSLQGSTTGQRRERPGPQTGVRNDVDRSVATSARLASLEKKLQDLADASSEQNKYVLSVLKDCAAILGSAQSDNGRLSGPGDPGAQAESARQTQKRNEAIEQMKQALLIVEQEAERIKQDLERTHQALTYAKEENESTKIRLQNKSDALERAKLEIRIARQSDQSLLLDNAKQNYEQANQELRKERREKERIQLELSSKNGSIRELAKNLQCMTRDHAKKEKQCEKLKEQKQDLRKKMQEQKAEKLNRLPMAQDTFAVKDDVMLSLWSHLQDTIKNMATLYLNNAIPLSQLSREEIAVFEEVTAEYETVGTTKGQVHYLFQAVVWKFISDVILSKPTMIWGRRGYAKDIRNILESLRC
jgi:DNA repair exonuclease SbcCD ATPase subunit